MPQEAEEVEVPGATAPQTPDAMERQLLREQAIGYRRVERYASPEARSEYVARRHVQYLLEEAILSLLIDEVPAGAGSGASIDVVRDKLRKEKLEPVRFALKGLVAARRGQPSTFKRFWELLDLPIAEDEPDAFDRLAELVFFTTLHEMLVSVVAAHKTEAGPEDGTLPSDASESDPGDDGADEQVENTDEPWPWIPERQLYQRVWQAFQLNLVDFVSRGDLRMPRWLKVTIDAQADDDSIYRALEARLEAGFQRAIDAPSAKTSRRKKVSPLDKLRQGPAGDAAVGESSQEEATSQSERSYSEIAEEFSSVLVQLVGEMAGDDAFRWFIRRRPPSDGRGLCSWVPTPSLLAKLRDLPNVKTVHTVPVNAPLIVPPKPWRVENLSSGGYYRRRLAFYKFHDRNSRIGDFLNACIQPELQPALDVVNAIQNTPYRINDQVWQVAQRMLERVDILKRSRRRRDESAFEMLDSWLRSSFAAQTLAGRGERVGEQVGDRIRRPLTRAMIDDLAALDAAGQAVPLYFAHQADSRGRLYAVTQWLSPQGEDLSRALLQFASGKPISEAGVRGLAVHGSQQIRFETILEDLGIVQDRPPTLEERVQWIERHREEIVGYAVDPLASLGWLQAKNPFQYLAFCFVWADFLKVGPDAISHLPIHVDGVCNGLQHIAALTGDPTLAAATNLQPGEPQDIYLHVMRLAAGALESQGDGSPYAAFATQHRLIDRDLAKSVVMIIPYGAGDRGYTRAVRARLRSRMFGDAKSFDAPRPLGQAYLMAIAKHFPGDLEHLTGPNGQRRNPVSEHLSELTQVVANAFAKALEDAFPIIEKFKQRLRESASVIWASGAPMSWQAPSGALALQRAFKATHTIVDSRISAATFGTVDLGARTHGLKHRRIKFTSTRLSDEIDERGQATGILPNFIHSLDSSHLIKSIQLAMSHGLRDFSVIHDSFGTHAADLPLLSRCIRESFVDMYSSPLPLLTRFEQWCAALSIAARAPHIDVEVFAPHIKLTTAEKALYDITARWAGRDSSMALQLAREAVALVERRIVTTRRGELRSKDMKTIKKLLVFAADKIDLEWPQDMHSANISQVLESDYFFS